MVRMRQLVPGSTTAAIGGILVEPSGEVFTDPADMGEQLTNYWQTVFSEKQINRDFLD